MKRIINILIVLMCYSVNLLHAQDTLVLKSNAKFVVKILDVGLGQITYLNYFNLNGPKFSTKRIDVDYITYSDGYKQRISLGDSLATMHQIGLNNTLNTNESPRNLYLQGVNDAKQFYTGYRSAATGTLIVSLLSPLVGLIPAVACSTTPPQEKNLEYPDSKQFENIDYQRGYIKQAKKIKSNKVWTNWGIALSVNIALVIILQQ